MHSCTSAWLKQGRTENVFANMGLTSSAIRIFREFENQGIPILFIKGLSIEGWLLKAVSFSYARYKVSWNSHLHPSKYHYLSQWRYELFAPTYDEWESLELPDILTPLYRLWRPLRLGSKLLFRS